ncbi:hypothetical protein QUF64_08255 [Anaerolineales bacterium HSG6]|nr:hypothetical protein [Anaerolineales bacterium HSG6]
MNYIRIYSTIIHQRWLIIFVLLLATFFRFYRLADHPLGLFFDPAINGLDAVRLMERGGHTLFFPSNGGRESLFIYLLMPYIKLFQTTPYAIRALTSSLSLLTVALLYRFMSEIWERPQNLLKTANVIDGTIFPLALIASLTLSVSYWHVSISRLGQRPIMVALLSVPVFWFFLKGWQSGHVRWFILSGFFLGVGAYTYSASRLLPVILMLTVLPDLILPRLGNTSDVPESTPSTESSTTAESWSNRAIPMNRLALLRNLTLLTITALLIAAPMLWYFASHPALFTARAGSVMVWNFLDSPTEILAELGRNVGRVGGFFCCVGSPNPIFGLPDYPGLHPFLTPFLLIGLLVTLRHWRDLPHRLIALWWLIGVSPSVIAIEAPHPLRMVVAVVPTAILVSLGLHALYHRVTGQSTRFRLTRNSFFVLLLMGYLLSTITSYRAYFIDWTALQTTRGVYDYGAIAIRDTVLAHRNSDQPIYLPFERFNDSTLLFYLSDPFPRQATLSVESASQALVITPDRHRTSSTWIRLFQGRATILPPLTTAGQAHLQHNLTRLPAQPINTTDGETVARLTHLEADLSPFLQQPNYDLHATFGPLTLTGALYSHSISAELDETWPLPVTLFWQANQPTATEYEVLLRLVNDGQQALAQGDARPLDWVYPTSFWQPQIDQIVVQHQLFRHDNQPWPVGRYWLAVSVFDPATQQRLPLSEADSPSPDTYFIGPLKLPLSTSPQPNNNIATFGDVIRLTDYQIPSHQLSAGDTLELTLRWSALYQPAVDYTVFVHLLDEAGNLVAGRDAQPRDGTYPTTIWSPEEQIPDNHPLILPADLPSGSYQFAIGLYHQPTGQRLPLHRPNGQTDIDVEGRFLFDEPIIIK